MSCTLLHESSLIAVTRRTAPVRVSPAAYVMQTTVTMADDAVVVNDASRKLSVDLEGLSDDFLILQVLIQCARLVQSRRPRPVVRTR
jgi:hypothetical protein